jgi:vancomycin resistance protein YoaR
VAKVQKNFYIIFIAILIQTLLGISLGLTMLYLSSRTHVASNTYSGDIYLGKLDRAGAAKKIDGEYKDCITNKSFIIKCGENKFEVKYSDIDANLESIATIESIFGNTRAEAFKNLFNCYFSSTRRNVVPIISFSEGKFREKLNELGAIIDREPLTAEISVVNDKVIKNPEVNGIKLNVDNAVEKVRREIGSNIGGTIIFKEADKYELETIIPRYTMYDLEGLDEIITQYTTKITNLDTADSIFRAASAINMVKLLPADIKKGQKAGVFSFNKYLALADGIIEKNDEGYNQVASTLYAGVLNLAGIDMKYITRTPLTNTVDYIQTGLGARVMGNTYDFKFENTLDYPIMIYTEIQGDRLKVGIIGKKKGYYTGSTLETEIVQRYTPTVEYMENQDMKPGEKKLVSSGKEGLKVKVYRVTKGIQKEIIKQYLYEDKYEAEKAIIEIGPNTRWGEETVK